MSGSSTVEEHSDAEHFSLLNTYDYNHQNRISIG
jgi:hypothetical protein